MDTFTRRSNILSILIERGHETINNLADEFHVSSKTIRRDVEILSLNHPITTKAGRYYGGIYYDSRMRTSRNSLKQPQIKLLNKMLASGRNQRPIMITAEDMNTIQSIFNDYI